MAAARAPAAPPAHAPPAPLPAPAPAPLAPPPPAPACVVSPGAFRVYQTRDSAVFDALWDEAAGAFLDTGAPGVDRAEGCPVWLSLADEREGGEGGAPRAALAAAAFLRAQVSAGRGGGRPTMFAFCLLARDVAADAGNPDAAALRALPLPRGTRYELGLAGGRDAAGRPRIAMRVLAEEGGGGGGAPASAAAGSTAAAAGLLRALAGAWRAPAAARGRGAGKRGPEEQSAAASPPRARHAGRRGDDGAASSASPAPRSARGGSSGGDVPEGEEPEPLLAQAGAAVAALRARVAAAELDAAEARGALRAASDAAAARADAQAAAAAALAGAARLAASVREVAASFDTLPYAQAVTALRGLADSVAPAPAPSSESGGGPGTPHEPACPRSAACSKPAAHRGACNALGRAVVAAA
jgi:hypothetical protein